MAARKDVGYTVAAGVLPVALATTDRQTETEAVVQVGGGV